MPGGVVDGVRRKSGSPAIGAEVSCGDVAGVPPGTPAAGLVPAGSSAGVLSALSTAWRALSTLVELAIACWLLTSVSMSARVFSESSIGVGLGVPEVISDGGLISSLAGGTSITGAPLDSPSCFGGWTSGSF
jgi:hypothetical protein